MVNKQVARRTAKDKITYDKPKKAKKWKWANHYTQVDNAGVDNIIYNKNSKKEKSKQVSPKIQKSVIEKQKMHYS